MTMFVLIIVALIIFVVLVLPVLLLRSAVRSIINLAIRMSGTQDGMKYFLTPVIGLPLFIVGLLGLLFDLFMMIVDHSNISSERTFYIVLTVVCLALFIPGVRMMYRMVHEERDIVRRLYDLRQRTIDSVDDLADQEATVSAALHASLGVTSSAGKVLRCPSCGCECILPMGHAVLCAACGNALSMTAARYRVNTTAAHDGACTDPIPDDTARNMPSARPTEIRSVPAVRDSSGNVLLICPHCQGHGVRCVDGMWHCRVCGANSTLEQVEESNLGQMLSMEGDR